MEERAQCAYKVGHGAPRLSCSSIARFVVAAAVLLTSRSALAHEEADAPPVSLSQRETRAEPHPDCRNHVPLWEHTVAQGESLGLIAGRYGVRRSDVVDVNPALTNPDHIVPGQKIRVCPEIAPRTRKQVTHSVASGESLIKIAESHGLTYEELLVELEESGNDKLAHNPRRLQVGDKLEFWVDGGIVEDFLPPLPPKKTAKKSDKGKKRGGKRRPRHGRVNVQLSPSKDIYVKRPTLAFGTKKTVSLIESAVRKYKRRHGGGPKVVIGDISRRGGGQLKPHLSHRKGVDIDIGYVLKGAAANRTRFRGVNKSNLDLARTWGLVKAFIDTDAVVYIFMDYALQKQLYDYAVGKGVSKDELDALFQYPRGRGRSHGIIRHWRSHKNHFHVRFRQ